MSQEEIQKIIETTDNYNGYLLSYFSNQHLTEILKKKMEQQKQPIVKTRYMKMDGTIETTIDILNAKMLENIEKNYLNVRELEDVPPGSDMIFSYELSHAISIEIKEASNFSGLKEKKMLAETREASERFRKACMDPEVEMTQYEYKKGAYFNYINTIPIDLSRYQIGNTYEEHMELNRHETCFIYALI